jgi:hypothetical protein
MSLFVSACSDNDSPVDTLELLPPPERDGGLFGVDLNINMTTIDDWLERSDVVYIDMRMLYDSATFEDIGGEPYLTRTLPGYRIVPLPYIATLDAMPVSNAYEGEKLFEVVWSQDNRGEILEVTANYLESEAILNELFPKDKVIFLMCGGAGYSYLTRQFLNHMGWDENMIYSTGGNWYYEGNRGLDMTTNGLGDRDAHIATWRVNYAYIDFDSLNLTT